MTEFCMTADGLEGGHATVRASVAPPSLGVGGLLVGCTTSIFRHRLFFFLLLFGLILLDKRDDDIRKCVIFDAWLVIQKNHSRHAKDSQQSQPGKNPIAKFRLRLTRLTPAEFRSQSHALASLEPQCSAERRIVGDIEGPTIKFKANCILEIHTP